MVDVRTSPAGRAVGCLLGIAALLAPVWFLVGGERWGTSGGDAAVEASEADPAVADEAVADE